MNNGLRKAFFRGVNNTGPDVESFIMTFALNASDSITLPLVSSGVYDFTVDWGDGTSSYITTWNQAQRVHSYSGFPAGDYVVKITGVLTYWSFGSVTTSRGKLKSIDQWGDVGAINWNTGFDGCSNLISVSPGIPETLTVLGAMFRGTTSLTSVPSNLFKPASTNRDCIRFFQNSSITAIPENLFQGQTGILDLQEFFNNCDSITSIPSGLFSGISVNTFNGIFINCNGITTIPENIFSTNISTSDFNAVFENCVNITSIPSNLFINNTGAINFNRAFLNTSITSIPSSLFNSNVNVTSFVLTFGNCLNLTSVPASLFANNTAVNNFQQLFDGSSSITTIASNLFATNTVVKNMSYVFRNCSSLAAIPSGLFNNNTQVTSFLATFNGCSSITSVPSGLFNNNTAVTIFGQSDSEVRGVFGRCTNLVTVPTNLFNNNTLVTNYARAFESCPNLNISISSFVSGMTMTSVTTTSRMFSGCSLLIGNGQDLINKTKAGGYTVGTGSNTGSYRTFFDCVSLADYATISVAYK